MNLICKNLGHDYMARRGDVRVCVRCECEEPRPDARAGRDEVVFASRHDRQHSDPKAIV